MRERLISLVLFSAICFAACARKDDAVNPKDQIPIACVLSALDADQRQREGALLKEHLAAIQEVSERAPCVSTNLRQAS